VNVLKEAKELHVEGIRNMVKEKPLLLVHSFINQKKDSNRSTDRADITD